MFRKRNAGKPLAREKVKQWKKALREYDAMTEQDVVGPEEAQSIALLETLEAQQTGLRSLYEDLAQTQEPEAFGKAVMTRLRSQRRAAVNVAKANQKLLENYDELSARWDDLTRQPHSRLKPPANSVIDLEETRSGHFASGMNLYKLLLVCFIGCFGGVVIELLWCLLTNGYMESRAGLVYGPFNMVYGAGALVLTIALYRYRNRGKWLSFLGGFLVGSALEYFCSWAQELLFGSVSWDYSHMPFNINGRICLIYSVFWGFLGVFWVKTLYPVMAELILKIPNRVGKILTWVLTAFFVFDCVVTLLAVFRWSQRVDMIPAANAFWAFIDSRFPNARMERIFANMVFR
ncbi:MAG: putative ABC transporter permease [Candidatus Faecousia sp.]|nr:putative ABC transporter permease [Candidatus Faecousia sp.]